MRKIDTISEKRPGPRIPLCYLKNFHPRLERLHISFFSTDTLIRLGVKVMARNEKLECNYCFISGSNIFWEIFKTTRVKMCWKVKVKLSVVSSLAQLSIFMLKSEVKLSAFSSQVQIFLGNLPNSPCKNVLKSENKTKCCFISGSTFHLSWIHPLHSHFSLSTLILIFEF